VRDALSVFKAKSFRAPAAPESLFSCVAKRKVTKREGHPGWRLPGILPSKFVRRGRAFRAGSCPREKASPSMASPAARPCRPRLTAAQGPRKSRRASCAPETEAEARAKRRAPAISLPCMQGRAGVGCCCCCFCAQERAASPGAPMARRAGGGKSAGWPAGMRASFPPAQGGAVGKPRNPPAHPEPMDGRRARHRGVVFSWLLLFWTSKREVARAAAAARNHSETCQGAEAKTPLPHPSPASGRGKMQGVASTRPSPQPSPRRGEGAIARSPLPKMLTCRSSRPGSPAAASTRPPARTT
jgi:hypothetical protein